MSSSDRVAVSKPTMGRVISRTDPRSAARITPIHILPPSVEELPPDHYSLLALVFALMAITLKVKLYSWITCLLSLASLVNARYSTTDLKAFLATISLVVLTFMSTHVTFLGQPVMAPVFPWQRNKS